MSLPARLAARPLTMLPPAAARLGGCLPHRAPSAWSRGWEGGLLGGCPPAPLPALLPDSELPGAGGRALEEVSPAPRGRTGSGANRPWRRSPGGLPPLDPFVLPKVSGVWAPLAQGHAARWALLH